MKTCPICGSVAFDDARICYGCLYDFSKVEDNEQSHDETACAASTVASSVSFVITLTPEGRDRDSVSWKCEIDAVPA